jgi:hypothetical protein
MAAKHLLAIIVPPCDHHPEEIRQIKLIDGRETLANVFDNIHGQVHDKVNKLTIKVSQSLEIDRNAFDVDGMLSIADVIHMNVKSIQFSCKAVINSEAILAKSILEKTTRKAVNAFELLRAGGRSYVEKKTRRCVFQKNFNII